MSSILRAPLPPIPSARSLKTADRGDLVEYYKRCRDMSNEWLRRQIIKNDRIDILGEVVLGLTFEPMHRKMLKFQFEHPDNLQLAFRGAGKSTGCTITKCIHLLLKDPNLRILISSKTQGNAQGFLKEIKNHFEGNQLLEELFGPYYDARKVSKWDQGEIEVLPRTKPNKEASITCVGVEATIVSKHYDVLIDDDIIDEDNSRTKLQRDKVRTWYYQTLDPTLEPPDRDVPHRGEHHRQGTRYHYDDLWGHLISKELKDHHQIIPGLKDGMSPWPKKYPVRWFLEKKKKAGLIIFNAQYQCDTEAMKGEIFQFDDCQQIDESEYPDVKTLRVFMGVDLAISEEESGDKFAIVVIGITPSRSAFYVLDYFEDQLRFSAQTAKIREFAKRWDPIRIGIETNAYQKAQYHKLKEDDPDIRLKAINTDKDKITRAWKLSPTFEEKKVFFKKNLGDLLVEHMVLFPNHNHDDLFDAFDHCIRASRASRRGKREKEPGLI